MRGPSRSCWGCSTSYHVDVSPGSRRAVKSGPATCRARNNCFRCPAPAHTFRPTFGASLLLAGVRCWLRPQTYCLQIQCSKRRADSSNSKRPRRGWPPWNWLEHIPSIPRLVFNLTALFLLMRIWPLSGRSPLGQAQPVSVQVPFSEFIEQTQSRQVVAVTVDNRNIKYVLRPEAPLFKILPETEQTVNVEFQTTRPADYTMPYDMLTKQGIQFGAVDNRNNTFLTVMVCLLLLLSSIFCHQPMHKLVHDYCDVVLIPSFTHSAASQGIRSTLGSRPCSGLSCFHAGLRLFSLALWLDMLHMNNSNACLLSCDVLNLCTNIV